MPHHAADIRLVRARTATAQACCIPFFVPSILLHDDDTVFRGLSFRDERTAPAPFACRPVPAVALVTSQLRTLAPHPIGPIQRVQVVASAAYAPCRSRAALPRLRRVRSGLGRADAAGRSRPGAQRRDHPVTSASVGTGRHGTIVAVKRMRRSGIPCLVVMQQHSACRAEHAQEESARPSPPDRLLRPWGRNARAQTRISAL